VAGSRDHVIDIELAAVIGIERIVTGLQIGTQLPDLCDMR
jgi:hypothetical protein